MKCTYSLVQINAIRISCNPTLFKLLKEQKTNYKQNLENKTQISIDTIDYQVKVDEQGFGESNTLTTISASAFPDSWSIQQGTKFLMFLERLKAPTQER